ncbi:DNA polymerase III subunit delta [Desmospora profundinema]|uniref:DNA polymerase III subunit delta n=1 Tax=Desmospora profundinema TaxID=1571184 RepID=A0ABU1IKK7_9BACL|nr:DNA polymerase III subunit delta [Desmospora profundinema]MDR6225082.1 DNA polymerase-3 subunit delta [Desmospora profundinema]
MDQQLAQELKQGKIAPLYLFYGTESYLMEETSRWIRQRVLSDEKDEWSQTVMDLEETAIQDVVREVETASFFGEARVVVAHHAWFLTGARKKSKVDHQPEELLRYAQAPVEENVLILTVEAAKLDSRKKLVKELKKKARVAAFPPLESKELERWVAKRIRQAGLTPHPQAADSLIRNVGSDLRLLNGEIEKLAAYVGKGGTLTPAEVAELVPRTLEQDVFKLINQVAQRRTAEALSLFYDLLANREEPIRILSLVIRQFRILLQVKVLAREGKSEREIASLLGLHPYPVKLALQQGRSFPEETLRALLERSIAADHDIKKGRIDKVLAVERLLLSLEMMDPPLASGRSKG